MFNNDREINGQDKNEYWRTHVGVWKQSGINQAEYCRRHELSVKIFGYWKRKLCRKSAGVSFMPVSIKPPHISSVKSGSFLRLVTCNGLSIEVGDGFNPAALRMLLDAIGQRV